MTGPPTVLSLLSMPLTVMFTLRPAEPLGLLLSRDLLFDAFAFDVYWKSLGAVVKRTRKTSHNPKFGENFELMAEMAGGHADDLASTVLLAADKKVLMAPAMNPQMWDKAATQRNLQA